MKRALELLLGLIIGVSIMLLVFIAWDSNNDKYHKINESIFEEYDSFQR
jgi:hypothetical protein